MGGHNRIRSSTGARIVNADRAGPYQRRLFGCRFTQAAIGFMVQRLQLVANIQVISGEPLCAVCQRKCEYFCVYCHVYPLCSASCAFKGYQRHKSYCVAQSSMYDKESENVIEFSLPNGLDSLKVCHEYLPLKYLAKGKPNEQVKPTPVAAVVKHGLDADSVTGPDDTSSRSKSMRSNSSRGPPKKPEPAATAQMLHSLSRPLSMSIENRGGGTWGGLGPFGPPAGPGAGGNLFDMEGESLFGGSRPQITSQIANLGEKISKFGDKLSKALVGDRYHSQITEPLQLVVDGK